MSRRDASYIYFTLACGVSPFLYVLGMLEFRQKVKDLVEIPKRAFTKLKKNSVHPANWKNYTSNQVNQPVDNTESHLPGPSGT